MAEHLAEIGAARFWPVMLDGVVFEAGGRRLIDGLDLTLLPAGLTVMMGPNGAGKSLTVRLIAGLLGAHDGSVTYGGEAGAARKGDIALVFQRPVMLRRSVAGNLDHALRIYGLGRDRRAARISDMLQQGQLADMADSPARALSAGEQQRLALVRALACDPKLLLLDEPTANLDPQATAAIEALVRKAVESGIKCVMITHDRTQARRLGDDIVFLHKGRVVEHSPAKRFFKRPASTAARAYLKGELLV